MEISIKINGSSKICSNHWIHMSWIHMSWTHISWILQDFVVKCPTTGLACRGTCHKQPVVGKIVIPLPFPSISGAEWYQPTTLPDLFQRMALLEGKKVFYVAGHTSVGVYNDGPYDAAVDTKKVADLFLKKQTATNVYLGANVTLTDIVDFFKDASQSPPFRYLDVLADHIRRIAGTPVRNVSVNIFLFHVSIYFVQYCQIFYFVVLQWIFYPLKSYVSCYFLVNFSFIRFTFYFRSFSFPFIHILFHVSIYYFFPLFSFINFFFFLFLHFCLLFSFIIFLHFICYFKFLCFDYSIEFLHFSLIIFFPSFFLFCPIFLHLSFFIRFN